MPPSHSAGGDLIDQVRDWFDRLRHGGNGAERGGSRLGRRTAARQQAVPLDSYQSRPMPRRRPVDRRAGSLAHADRAERSTYTLVFAAVLVALLIALFFLLSWLLGAGGPLGSAPQTTPTPAPQSGQLPAPAPISSPPPFFAPSPSPSPSPAPAAPTQGRVHIVQAGDTLNRIAQQYGVTVEAIMQANGRTDRNQILRIGERLVIPEPPPR